MSILWPLIVSALLPLDLTAVQSRLPLITASLNAMDDTSKGKSGPRQVADFKARHSAQISAAGTERC